MQKLATLLFSCLILASCNQSEWRNKVDPLILDCGLVQDADLSERSLLRFNTVPSLDPKDLTVYRVESDPDQVESLKFELTPKGCLMLWNKDLTTKTGHISIVTKNSQGLDLGPEDFANGFIHAEFQDCGGNCAVFPLCGPLPLANGDLAFKINAAPGTKLNASIEYDFVNTPLEVNARQCFTLPRNSRGTLKLQDASGNFLEAQPENLLREGGQQPVLALSLRGPLTAAEKQCKADAQHLRMEGDACVPKTFQSYCEDNPGLEGVIIVSSDFVRKDCSYIERWLKNQTNLDYGNRKLSDAQVLSGLENVKTLDLRANRLGTLDNLMGTFEVEDLSLSLNEIPFDIASIQRFPHLKRLDIRQIELQNLEKLPIMPQLESLATSGLNRTLLEKFPNLKKLTLISNDKARLSDLPPFTQLESLDLESFPDLSDLDSLKRYPGLRSLRIFAVDGLTGQNMPVLPALESLVIDISPLPGLLQLEKAKKLTNLFLDQRYGLPELMPQLRYLKRVEIDGGSTRDLSWLVTSQDLEEMKLLGEFTSLASLPFLPSLRVLEASGGMLETVTGLDKLPNLVRLDLSNQTDALAQDLVNLPSLPHLEWFEYSFNGTELTEASITWLSKMPNLRTLAVDINAREPWTAALLPRGLETLVLAYPVRGDLSFLQDLPNLHILSLDLTGEEFEDAKDLRVAPLDYLKLDVNAERIAKFPVFTDVGTLKIDILEENSELIETNRLPEKLQRVHEITIAPHGSPNLDWLASIQGLERLEVGNAERDITNLPVLPDLKYLYLASNQLREIRGIEAFTNLEEIEFFQSNTLKSLASLRGNTKLKRISAPKENRGNFRTAESCPETADAPEGLRNYCQDLHVPYAAYFGPMPF